MLRVALLNGKNKNYDRDFSKILEAIAGPGVISGFDIVEGMLQPGKGFIEVTRVDLDTFYCYVENTTEVAVDVTGTKKVWLEVKQANIDDGTLNSPDGSGIVELKTGASYPADNFLKIASIASGVITDEREYLSIDELKVPFTKSIKDLSDVYNFEDPIVKKFIVFDPVTGKINIGDVDSTDIPTVNSLVNNSIYMIGEASGAGKFVFKETGPTFAQATNIQNIGNVSGNTRGDLPVISTGVYSGTFNLSAKKFVSPSVNLTLRLETDDGTGKASGTLVHANSVATIAPGSLTTSLADTAFSWNGAFTMPAEGTRLHLVPYQGTYGSETINGTNYYGIGYSTNDTTTRGLSLWNGSTRGTRDTAKRCYVSSTSFSNILLSLTDSDFSYKVDWYGITTESCTVGSYPKLTLIVEGAINEQQSGMTEGVAQFLQGTPGTIGSMPGTNAVYVGYAKSTTKLCITHGKYPSVTAHTLNITANRTQGSGYVAYSSTYTPTKKEAFSIYLSAYGSASSSAYAKMQFSGDGSTWIDIFTVSVGEGTVYDYATVVLYPGLKYRSTCGVGAYTANSAFTVKLISEV